MSELEALQKALAGEHAAVYGYGLVGARLGGRDRAAARAAYDAHLARRDRLAAMISGQSATPEPALPAYEPPFPVTDAASAVALAVTLEDGLAATYADGVAQTAGATRELMVRALYEAAVRATRWRGTSTPFPGLPEQLPS
jgi:hypothetical protein